MNEGSIMRLACLKLLFLNTIEMQTASYKTLVGQIANAIWLASLLPAKHNIVQYHGQIVANYT